jgi:hypothetical protein
MEGFEKLRRQHPSHHVVHLFHGTSENNLESIIANGFLVKHAQSGGGLIWFSRQSTYSYAFTMNQGKGLSGQPASKSIFAHTQQLLTRKCTALLK